MLRLSASVYCVVIFVCVANSMTTTPRTNYPLTTTQTSQETTVKSRYEMGLEDYDEAQAKYRQSRGMSMDDYMDHVHDHDHDDHDKPEQKAVKEDPWASYYDFIINEGSFKFWAVFQLVTAALLIYSAFAAVYYAKFNVITTDYDYEDDFFKRSNDDSVLSSMWSGMSAQTFQRIFDALSSKKYS
ncbi:uncharacterized protein LOC109599148 [Aethina tumida]|uniref:uncharacterized protein LOC109599148 n=1 Tax=Aethina tumida TaxID=116153 RepID=UPI00096AD9EC|nr:uncharacterized protein LOC109599148 [Aethina tumida]